jgi:hypothetical protein
MADQSIPLSVYLLRSDRVASFEAALSVGTAALPLTPPLDGYAIGLPSNPRTAEWVRVIQSVLQSPTGLSKWSLNRRPHFSPCAKVERHLS